MKTMITSILICGFGVTAFGQGSVTMNTSNSNVKYIVSNNGTFFHNTLPGATGGYVVP